MRPQSGRYRDCTTNPTGSGVFGMDTCSAPASSSGCRRRLAVKSGGSAPTSIRRPARPSRGLTRTMPCSASHASWATDCSSQPEAAGFMLSPCRRLWAGTANFVERRTGVGQIARSSSIDDDSGGTNETAIFQSRERRGSRFLGTAAPRNRCPAWHAGSRTRSGLTAHFGVFLGGRRLVHHLGTSRRRRRRALPRVVRLRWGWKFARRRAA